MRKYHFKHEITHPDQNVSEKVNYFADYFDFTLNNYGKPSFKELENHKSLLEKIKFQLDNYSSFSQQYLKHYFKNSYLSKKDWLIKSYYLNEWQKINSLKQEFFVDFTNTAKRKELNTQISDLIEKLDESLFENALNKIIVAILCKDGLNKHDHIAVFEYYTPILLSEFVFSGFPKKDLEKLFDKILTKDIEFENNKVRTNAPLPKSLLDIKNEPGNKPENFYIAVNNYLKNRTLKQQFEGIYNLYKNSLKEKTYLFRLTNVKTFNPTNLNYNNVNFSNQIRKKYVERGKTIKEYREFFQGKGTIYAEIVIKENNDEIGKSNAILKINDALNFFNFTFKKNARLEIADYIIKDDSQNVRHTNLNENLYSQDTNKFTVNNPYEIFKNHKSHLTSKFLILDAIYFQALNSDLDESKVVNYWRYIEAFFEASNFNSEKTKKTLSLILSRQVIPDFALNYFNLACKILNSAYYRPIKSIRDTSGMNQFLNISDSELKDLLQPIEIKNINFRRLEEIIKHPYITKQLKWYINKSDEEKIKIAFDFYLNILTETYEQRNFIEHAGIYNRKAIEKILMTLPDIVAQFRNLLIIKLKKSRYSTFEEVINDLLS